MKVSSYSIQGLRRYGCLKNFNQKHPEWDADANFGVTTIALPRLRTGELIKISSVPMNQLKEDHKYTKLKGSMMIYVPFILFEGTDKYLP